MQLSISTNRREKLLSVPLILAGISAIVLAFTADALGLSPRAGFGANEFYIVVSGIAVLLTGIIWASAESQRYISEWLLVGAGVLATALAADLWVVNGFLRFNIKLLMLAAVGFSLLLAGPVYTSALDARFSQHTWRQFLSTQRESIGKFLAIVAQLGLLALVIGLYELENPTFAHRILALTFYGFIFHALLPLPYRLPFFLLISLAAMTGILGFFNGLWVIGLGIGLIGICHLPFTYRVRVLLLLSAGGVLVALRAEWFQAPWPSLIWPILGSMFMFRLIIYLYDLNHRKEAPTLTSTLAYFFLFPNIVFPFFPVIDYSTFRRTYYDSEHYQLYQKGIQWMVRGVMHLLLYRAVNYYLVIAPQEVTNTTEFVRYLIANFALYLRVSGQFHLCIGMLHLFGFNLPETHHLYFLAASFTDLWRRINIYWKDFMLKLFYYPAYFQLRRWHPTTRLIIATLFVFVATWFFHAYQWFWLRGSFLFTVPDILFWTVLALLVVVNTLYETKRGRWRTLGQRRWTLGAIAPLALQTAATFTTMCLLWSLWTSESLAAWGALLAAVEPNGATAITLSLVFLAITVSCGLAIWVTTPRKTAETTVKAPTFFGAAVTTGAFLLLLYGVGTPTVYQQVGEQAQAVIAELTQAKLSDRDAATLQQGYYEELIGVNRFNSELWEIYAKQPATWVSMEEAGVARLTGDRFFRELIPNQRLLFHDAQFSTNRWGMRDREYSQTAPPNAYRIALLGPSFVMGESVADDEVFEAVLEERLNLEQRDAPYGVYEILNFGVGGYSALQELMILEEKVPAFQPNALFVVAHQREAEFMVSYLAKQLLAKTPLPYTFLTEIGQRAGIDSGLTQVVAEKRLQPLSSELLAWTYQRMVEHAHTHNMLPVWLFVPTLEAAPTAEQVAHLAQLAANAGFVVLDLSTIFVGHDLDSLMVAEWDRHLNAQGHQIVAQRLFEVLSTTEETRFLGLSAQAQTE